MSHVSTISIVTLDVRRHLLVSIKLLNTRTPIVSMEEIEKTVPSSLIGCGSEDEKDKKAITRHSADYC